MGNIFVLIFVGVVLAMVEVIFTSASLISPVAVVALLLSKRLTVRSSVIVYLMVTLLIDPFYGHLLGVYFISITALLLAYNTLKRVLPYEQLLVRIIILFLSFMIFHFFKMIMIDISSGSLVRTDGIDILLFSLPRSIIETVIFLLLDLFNSNYLGGENRSVKVKI